MGFRYALKLYVLTTASNVRTHVRSKIVANKALFELMEKEAPKLRHLLDNETRLLIYAGKHPTRMSLEEAASKLIYDVGPILAVARESGKFVRVDIFFSDTTITNAFKSGSIERWKQRGFTSRSGGQVLEHGSYWAILHRLVSELKAVVCYTPFDDPLMHKLHDELKAEYRTVVKQLKKSLNGGT